MEGNFIQAPQERQPMTRREAAEHLGLVASEATAVEIIAAYDAIVEGDKRTSEWAPERSTLDEKGIPAQLDWFIEDLREEVLFKKAADISENMSRGPSMVAIAESLQNLGFNVTENDEDLMREAIQELIDKGDEGIHSLPPGAERALGL
jgi:ABC-type cobalamin/Fe3+-siderophores transport system ATPase subunit